MKTPCGSCLKRTYQAFSGPIASRIIDLDSSRMSVMKVDAATSCLVYIYIYYIYKFITFRDSQQPRCWTISADSVWLIMKVAPPGLHEASVIGFWRFIVVIGRPNLRRTLSNRCLRADDEPVQRYSCGFRAPSPIQAISVKSGASSFEL